MTNEQCWTILRSECTLGEAMKIYGLPDDMGEAVNKSTASASIAAFMIGIAAYKTLVERGVIDNLKMFLFRTASEYNIGDKIAQFDTAAMNGVLYRWKDPKWEKMYDI